MRSMDKQVLLEDDPHTSHYRHKRNFFSGGGGLVGTTADYMAFCEMLRQGGQFNGYHYWPPNIGTDDGEPFDGWGSHSPKWPRGVF